MVCFVLYAVHTLNLHSKHCDTYTFSLIGSVYNELGLTYSQCHEFPRAATCFETALPLIRGPSGDRKQEAIILQNLGAVYNSLGDYQRALGFHESAAELHGKSKLQIMNNPN